MPAATKSRVFLLSPARLDGERAKLLFRDAAAFPLARRLRSPEGATIGEVFTFLSGLYFRGKLGYAMRFAKPPRRHDGVLAITSDRGLVPPTLRVTLDDLRVMGEVPIDVGEPRYREPLARDVAALAVGSKCAVVLLGSIASGKYAEPLLPHLGDRLLFPREFVGRGDMSRGGLLLRHMESGEELEYLPVRDAVRKGSRPPRLTPRPRAS